MNAWPTLREWMQFSGTLALELVVVFAVAKLVALRVRSAQGRRALWQITLLAMLLISVGELNGVRGWLRLPEKKISPPAPATQKVIVTLQDVEPGLNLLRHFEMAAVPPQPAPRPSRWQERAVWPALLWTACAALMLLRMIIGQGLAWRLRLASHRSSGQPCPLNINCAEGTADKAVRSSIRAWRNSDPALLQRLGHLAQSLGLRRNVLLLTSERTVVPFTFGVWRPVMVLPQNFTTAFTLEQQDAALAHELAHVANFDSAWRTLSQFACVVLWWHPLVWLTKRELDHASELVADEASLLVANGPDRLAECLLACAKQLRRPALAGWLGMDGGGFRSALGKRVTHLLQLNPHARLSRPVPWYLRLLAPVVCVALLWLGMAAVMKPGAPRGGAWRTSILGSAFAAAQAVKPSASAATTTNSTTVSNLILPRGNEPTPLHTRFFHMDTNDFHRVFNSAPPDRNSGSTRTLSNHGTLANGTNSPTFLTEVTPAEVVIPEVQNWLKFLGVELTTPGKAVFYNDKLGMLMVRATLEDLDMVEKGLQTFGIEWKASTTPRSASELTNRLSSDRTAAGESRNGTQEMQIEGARLVQAGKTYYETGQMHAARTNLQAALLLQPANQGALYFLDLVNARELAVRAKLKDLKMEPMDAWTNQVQDTSSTNLQTRFFKVDPNTLEQGLKSISAHDPRGGKKPVFNPYDTNSVIERVQRLFQTAGVDLSAPGRALFYQDRVGTVMVRATPAEMETVEKAIQLLNITPPQLTIRVKVFEVAKTNAAQGLDWFLGTVLTNPPPRNRADPNAPVPTITGILTEWQFRDVVRALEQRGGTDLLSAPEVTTMSGRQAQIKVVNIQYIVTDLDIGETNAAKRQPAILPLAEPFELGPKLDVVPYVQTDGYTIQMSVITSLKEFLGYEDSQTVQPAIAGAAQANGVTSPMPLPKFRLRQVATSALVWDGQTLMIGAGSARTMQRQPDANGVITTNYTEKELIYFITPRLIDAAGNPLHADDEFPERHKTVPAQRNSGGKP